MEKIFLNITYLHCLKGVNCYWYQDDSSVVQILKKLQTKKCEMAAGHSGAFTNYVNKTREVGDPENFKGMSYNRKGIPSQQCIVAESGS